MSSMKSPYQATPYPVFENLNKKYAFMWDEIAKLRFEGEKNCANWLDLCYVPQQLIDDAYYKRNPSKLDLKNVRAEDAALGISINTSYLWGQNKCIFRFNDDLYRDLESMDLQGAIPIKTLEQLPYRAVYIETPGLEFRYMGSLHHNLAVKGFSVFFNYDLQHKRREMYFMFYYKDMFYPLPSVLPFEEGDTVNNVINRAADLEKEIYESCGLKIDPVVYRDTEYISKKYALLFNLLLYICVKDSDYQKPEIRIAKTRAVKPSIITVGDNIGIKIRKYRASGVRYISDPDAPESLGKRTVAKHMRRAHYQLYWTGKGRTTPKIVYKHPCFVNFDKNEDVRPGIVKVTKD